MGLFENTAQDLNYKAMEVDTSSLSQTQYINSNSIYRGDVRVDVYNLDDEADSHYKATDTLTAEDLEFFIGKMSDKEYADFVKEIENYYDDSIKSYEKLLSNAEETLKILNDPKALEMAAIDNLDQNALGGRKDEILNQLYWFVQDKKYEGTGVTREELENMDDDERIQYIIKYDEEAKRMYDEWMKAKTEVADEYIKSKFKDLGITTLDEYIKCRNTLIDKKENMKEAIKTTKNLKQSAYYDNLKYLSDYNNYKEHEFTDEERDYVKKKSYTSPTMNDSYDYNDFHNKFPDTTPLDFVKLLQETHPSGNYTVTGIKDLQNLKTIANACDKIPDLSKTYEYLYSQSPEKAGEYLKDIQYELNNIEGQLRAERFLSLLGESDGNDDVLEIIANELGVTVEGLTDGLESFGSGVGYSFEALLTSLGITEENRTMSAEEYKKMYILYGLLDEESKIKTGLLTKNDNGQLENTNPNSIIDYTKTYSGGITLKWNYEISQGIGNMIPSIAISYACPIAGSIAMGVSAGGNAYHDAMVNGDSLFSSIMYGVFTGTSEAITERILGGLPGLSDVQVTSLATYAKACVSEGFQESFQGVMDAVYRASFMGEELPTTAEGWEEFGKDILKQGIYGAVTAGIMQSPALATSLYGKFQYNQIMNQNNISKADQKAAIKYLKDNDTTGKFEGMTNDKIKLQYGNEILAVALQNIKNQTQGYNNDVISSEHNNNIVGESEEIYDPNEWNEGDITEEIPIIAEIDQDETGEYDSAAWDDGDITEEIPIVAEIDQDETGEYDSSVKYEDNNSYNESVIDDNSEINSDKESSVLPINKINEGLGFFTNYDKDTRYFVNDVITGFNSLINLSLSDFNRFIESSFGRYSLSLSESSLDACRGYTGYDYKNINSGLISGLIFNSDAGYLKRLCNGIDEAIYKYGGLKEDSIFYREFHIDNSHVKKNSLYAKLIENIDCSDINQVYSMFSALIGKEISNPNYQSSSFIKGGAQLDANVMFEIKAPKGTAGVDISILSERTGILNEDEFLFARNTDLKIENVSLQEFNGQTIVYVECTAESNFEYNNINNSKLIIDSYIDFISNVLNELTESYKKNYEYAKQHDQYENSFDDFLNEYPPLNYFDYKNKLDLLIKIREMIYNELQK